VKSAYKTGALYQHQNTLKTVLQSLGIETAPGAAAAASPMNVF
jgi:hypothetical protein